MIFFLLGHLTTLLLFFLRVRAVFFKKPWMRWFFFLVWLVTAAICALLPFYVRTSKIQLDDNENENAGANVMAFSSLQTCIQTTYRPACVVCLITTFLNDTAVFFAVSLQLMSSFADDESMSTFDLLKCIVWKRKVSLPTIAGTLLRGGQQYYL